MATKPPKIFIIDDLGEKGLAKLIHGHAALILGCADKPELRLPTDEYDALITEIRFAASRLRHLERGRPKGDGPLPSA